MNKYLAGKRRKKLISRFKFRIMNKKAKVSNNVLDKLGSIKGGVSSKIDSINKKREEAKKEITQDQIDDLVEKKGVKREPREKAKQTTEKEGWKELDVEEFIEQKDGSSKLEEEKIRIKEKIARIERKEREEKEKLSELSDQKGQENKEQANADETKRRGEDKD